MNNIKFKIGDEVSWFEDRYSVIKHYGTIIKLTKTLAYVQEIFMDDVYITKVNLRKLNWS